MLEEAVPKSLLLMLHKQSWCFGRGTSLTVLSQPKAILDLILQGSSPTKPTPIPVL